MKALTITPEMQARINTAAGTDVDPTTITAFECVALTNRPVQKRGSIFDGAVPDANYFSDMANFLAKNAGVQLMSMHNTDVLPTGRVFYAAPSVTELRAQFYIPNDKVDLISDINKGVVGDVSIGALAQHLLCSKCNWDYRGSDATFMNLYERTCANDHVIGEDGTHLIMKGVESWGELSVCGKGASPGAKIVSRMKAALMASGSTLESLAASGTDLGAILLSTPPIGDGPDMKDLLDKIEAQGASIATLTSGKTELEGKLTASDAKVAELTSQLSAADAAKATAEAALAVATAAKDTAELALTAVKTENSTVMEFLTEQGKKAMIQLGKKAEDVPTTSADLIAKIKEAGVTLANLVAGTGKSQTKAGEGDTAKFVDVSAFSTRNINQS